jgi:hypothetical protein
MSPKPGPTGGAALKVAGSHASKIRIFWVSAWLTPRVQKTTNMLRAIPLLRILYLLGTVLSPPRECPRGETYAGCTLMSRIFFYT